MAKESFRVREYTPADRAVVVSLIQEHMGFERFDESLARWKWEESIGGKALCLVTETEDRIVGFCSLLPSCFLIGGQELVGWRGDDVVVHKDYRRQGIFTKMYSRALDIIDSKGNNFTYCFPSKAAYGGYGKMGYREVAEIPQLFLITGMKYLLEKRLPKFAVGFIASCTPACYKSARFVKKWRFSEEVLVKAVRHFDNKRVVGGERESLVRVKKEAEYLNWRYFTHPWHRYRVFLATRGTCNLGYVVLRGQNLVDIEASSSEVFRLLLSTAIECFVKEGVPLAHTYLQCDENRRRILREAGFLRWKLRRKFSEFYPQQIVMARKNPAMKRGLDIYDGSKWYFCMGDVSPEL